MHTIIIIAAGLALLGALILAAGFLGKSAAWAALWFVPLWLIGAGINMWFGISRAGYTAAQEFPIFLVVFGVPVLAALIVRWRSARELRSSTHSKSR